MRFPLNQRYLVHVLVWAMLSVTPAALACTTPVYQYALEQWPGDDYIVTTYRRGALPEAGRAALEQITRACSDEDAAANLRLDDVELAPGEAPPDAGSLAAPCIVVMQPRVDAAAVAVWRGPLSADAVSAVLDSPVRREIAKRLLAGHAAVWVLVECGDAEADAKAAKTLDDELAKHNKALAGLAAELQQAGASESPAPRFSVLRLSRKDTRERVFLSMLMKSEADLAGFAGRPMAFPVFGRGRVLYALIGRGINARIIEEACTFLMGPCACVIKDQQPGTDLLMAVNWEEALLTRGMAGETLPPLSGVLPGAAGEGRAEPARNVTLRNAAIALLAVGLVVVTAGLVLRRRRREEGSTG